MSYRKDDWDLCWYDLSSTGCRNSTCKWRHVTSSGQLYSSPYQESRGKVGCRRGDPRRNPGTPFDTVMQHQDGRIEDQYGFVHSPDIDDENVVKFRKQFMSRYESKHDCSDLSPMSVSSCKTPTSNPISIKTS